MPLLDVKLAGAPDPALAARAAATLSDLTARILRKDPALTAVAVSFVPAEQWFVGGRSLVEANASSFALDILIVDGTNTKDEKVPIFSPCSTPWPNCCPGFIRRATSWCGR